LLPKKPPPPPKKKKIKASYKITLECHKVVENLADMKDTIAMEFNLRDTHLTASAKTAGYKEK